ncbi:hypothetical protein PG997_009120 [Apiospora hydei]|uniref:Uncharacterized protein n=1 Tax=Apiospora hydei TaxID=1337664 RepID=A0ABR1VTG8_9PEZI
MFFSRTMGTGGMVGGGVATYLVWIFLVPFLVGQVCECGVFQRHLESCQITNGTLTVRTYVESLANISKIAVHTEDYRHVASVLRRARIDSTVLSGALQFGGARWDYIKSTENQVKQYDAELLKSAHAWNSLNQILKSGTGQLIWMSERLHLELGNVVSLSAYIGHLLGSHNFLVTNRLSSGLMSCIESTLEILDRVQKKVHATETCTHSLNSLAHQVTRAAEHAAGIMYQDGVHRTADGLVYAQVSCGWFNLCGLMKPKPISSHDVTTLVHILEKQQKYHKEAQIAIEAIRSIITDTRHSLRAL